MFIQFVFACLCVSHGPCLISLISPTPFLFLQAHPRSALSQVCLLCLAPHLRQGWSRVVGAPDQEVSFQEIRAGCSSAAEAWGVGVGVQGGCWRLGRGRGRGWRHSGDESLSPAWRAAEGPSLVCLSRLWELCLGETWQYLRLPPVSGGPHFRREDGLRLSGARSPSLQKRLSSHFTGENSEAEGGGRRACDGPTPSLLSVSFQRPLLRAELPQQPQPLAWTLQG